MIIALLQARTDSTRLPQKVLKPILDKPMIIHQLERTSKSKLIDKLILVTSSENSDDRLSQVVTNSGFDVYRGDKNNVLKRFFDALNKFNLKSDDIIVRVTGDCPLHDATIIDEAILSFQNSKCDYLANCIEPIYPDGLDVEVFNYQSLREAYLNATKNSQKEHVTPYIRDSGLFVTKNLQKKPIYSNWRLTVDEPRDFELIEKIYNYFGDNQFSFEDIVKYIELNPKILEINSSINRNEGYIKSLEEDNR